MSDKYIIEGDTLTDIADALRLKRDIVTEITPEDMALQVALIESGGSLRTASGEITLAKNASTFTVTDNLNSTRKMLVWSPVGTCNVDATNRVVAGIAVAASAINNVITADVSAYNTAATTLTKDLSAAAGATDSFFEWHILSGANTATAFVYNTYQNTQSTSRVLFSPDTTRWWSNYVIPQGTYKWTVVAFD